MIEFKKKMVLNLDVTTMPGKLAFILDRCDQGGFPGRKEKWGY